MRDAVCDVWCVAWAVCVCAAFVCPSTTSDCILGGSPFRFAAVRNTLLFAVLLKKEKGYHDDMLVKEN
jgi:hypothetical protein